MSIPTDKSANVGANVTSLVPGMVAGADCIDDMALLRHGGMKKLFSSIYASSTLGSFLRTVKMSPTITTAIATIRRTLLTVPARIASQPAGKCCIYQQPGPGKPP